MAEINPVTGGARSGKSSYALQRVWSASTIRIFVATFQKSIPKWPKEEGGFGIVQDNTLARKSRDLAGNCNQTIGRAADEVVLLTCGTPLIIK